MEDMLGIIIGGLTAVVGYLLGSKLQPKNKTLAAQARWYEEELGSMRTEIKRSKAKAAYYAKGAVTAEIADAGSPEALIDAVLSALPANFRSMVAPFRASILQHAKDNPDLVKSITEAVKAKVSGVKSESSSEQQGEYL